MTAILQLALVLSVILFSAKLAGYRSVPLGQPSVLGELLSGAWRLGCPATDVYCCLERHLDRLTHNTRVAVYGGFLSVLVPTLLGWGIGKIFAMDKTL